MLGLNPHAGESGHLGREEIEVMRLVGTARGLGTFEVLSVDGSTRKGNLKVSLKVSREQPD